jgi:uncharacterized membrane protein YphA (DoxX/SURF4 family)
MKEAPMRNPLLIVGALLVVAGLLIASGMMKYQDKDTVADIGKLHVEASHEKTAPLNWGWVLIGGGALVLVGGALTKKS